LEPSTRGTRSFPGLANLQEDHSVNVARLSQVTIYCWAMYTLKNAKMISERFSSCDFAGWQDVDGRLRGHLFDGDVVGGRGAAGWTSSTTCTG
jgi:hypothetical protein